MRNAISKQRRATYQEGILRAAASVFGRLGFNEAKMSDVASASGVSVGTLYNYFESKNALIAALIGQQHDAFRTHIAPVEDIVDPLERIRRIVALSYEFVDERAEMIASAARAGVFQAHIAAELSGDVDAPISVLVRKLFEDSFAQAAATGVLRKDLLPSQLALALDGIVSAIMHEWVRTGRAQPLVSQSDFVVDLFMKGALPK